MASYTKYINLEPILEVRTQHLLLVLTFLWLPQFSKVHGLRAKSALSLEQVRCTGLGE